MRVRVRGRPTQATAWVAYGCGFSARRELRYSSEVTNIVSDTGTNGSYIPIADAAARNLTSLVPP